MAGWVVRVIRVIWVMRVIRVIRVIWVMRVIGVVRMCRSMQTG